MSTKKRIGNKGEGLVLDFLERKGYLIEEKNWRKGSAEADLIMWDDDVLVIVEVKTRTNENRGEPASFVSESQAKRLIDLAGYYMHEIDFGGEVRFDVVGVTLDHPLYPIIRHYEGAFRP